MLCQGSLFFCKIKLEGDFFQVIFFTNSQKLVSNSDLSHQGTLTLLEYGIGHRSVFNVIDCHCINPKEELMQGRAMTALKDPKSLI